MFNKINKKQWYIINIKLAWKISQSMDGRNTKFKGTDKSRRVI